MILAASARSDHLRIRDGRLQEGGDMFQETEEHIPREVVKDDNHSGLTPKETCLFPLTKHPIHKKKSYLPKASDFIQIIAFLFHTPMILFHNS
jgi:hypothetical protein